MKSVSYVIDPEGDIELVLNKPNTQNIIPDSVSYGGDWLTTEYTNSKLKGRYTVFDNFDTPISADGEEFAEETPDVVRMRVSSKHLTFASKVFRAMLQGSWSEASSSSSSRGSPRQIATSDWDAKALAIVLDIIHGRFRQVPKDINLYLLARIATIVDYYQCYEIMEPISNLWLSRDAMNGAGMNIYCEYSLLRLYVAWVFEDEYHFDRVAHRVLSDSKGPSEFHLKDLPVGGVLDVLQDKRQELIGRILKGLDCLQETLRTENGCTSLGLSDCSSILLGTLMRERFRWEDQVAPLKPPYNGYTVVMMERLVGNFSQPHPLQPIYYNSGSSSSGKLRLHHRRDVCTIQGRMQKLMKGINNEVKGSHYRRIPGWGQRQKDDN